MTIVGMTSPYWPLAGLRLRTPDLELRGPTLADLDGLGALAADGVHDPAVQPFAVPWTDAEPDQRARSVLQYHWGRWAAWTPAEWSLDLAVVRDGVVVGTQGIGAHEFAIKREVHTGSWVGQRYHGQGIGTQMRAAVLHLAFDGLGARYATSAAFEGNAASLGVSRRLGYCDDGVEMRAIRGQPVVSVRLRIDRAAWEAHRRFPVEIDGLDACRAEFGVP